jgi:gliding motility-associated-like protein
VVGACPGAGGGTTGQGSGAGTGGEQGIEELSAGSAGQDGLEQNLIVFLFKNRKLVRIGIFVTCLVISVLQLSAQSGGSYLEFVENKGQWDTAVRFRAELGAGSIFILKNGFSILQQDTGDLRRIHLLMHGGAGLKGGASQVIPKQAAGGKRPLSGPGSGAADDPFLLHSHVYRVSFENANDNVEIIPEKPFSHHNNYLSKGSKSTVSNCGVFQGLTYKNLYDGIDLHYYTENGFVKYDLIVHPGADPGRIVLRYDGQKAITLRKNQINVQTTVGTVKELEPHSYQFNEQGRADVSCKYVLQGNKLRFKVDQYASDATLVIDPTEIFCSFTGSHSDNWGYTATYDNSGDLFLGGIVLDYGKNNSGNEYGTTPGAFQSTYAGGDGKEGYYQDGYGNIAGYYDYDIGLMKFNSSGTNRLWATYLGGTGDEQPHSMVCDAQGNLIVTGRTSSTTFGGVTLPTYGPCVGFDIFVAKLSADGSSLMGALKIGGTGSDGVNFAPKYLLSAGQGTKELRLNYGDDGRSEVILDANNNIYVAACTQSTDFPTTAGCFQPAFGGGDQDGVLIKLSSDVKSVLFSSFLGGSGTDAAFVLALSPIDNTIWAAGGTNSTNLMNATGGGSTLTASNNGGIDGFLAQVSNNGQTLMRTAYFGTELTDIIYGLGFDKYGYPYITGTTYSVIPVLNSPFNANGNQASGKQFITKLKPDLSGMVYSANFGPGGTTYPNLSSVAFLVDRCQNVYVSGWGGGIDPGEGYNNSGTDGLTTTSGAIRANTDNSDFYFFVLQKNAASQLYGSFFGQVDVSTGNPYTSSLGDHVDGGTSRFDAQGIIYQAICANCNGNAKFPTTAGAAFTSNGALSPPNGSGCNEAAVKIAFNFAGVSAGLKVVTNGRGDSVGCVPLTAMFSDTVRNAKSYIWNFGDGTILPTTSYTENHIYTAVGTYLVTLIAIDSNTCNIADTVYHTVIVGNNPASVNFDYAKVGPCTSMSYILTNLSGAPAAFPFSDTAFTWNFGDGTVLPKVAPGYQPQHSYAAPGPYNVTLTLLDTEYCNYPLDTTRILYVAQNVKASFTTPALGCVPYTAQFTNTSIAGQQFYWNFGDPASGANDSSDLSSPTHLYSSIGTYTVKLVVVDSSTCNITDSTSFTLTVQNKPTAAFTFSPSPPQPPNTPTVFTDASTPAVKYQWFFGDGTSETKTEPDTVVHLYNRTDTFQVCEVVTNASGCTDTACQYVPAVINPLLDVPNAFTPGRFGVNGVVKVVGFGITHMDWRIYNRWGQVVFESNDPNIGWDGSYRGTVQPMDVYAYTLEAQFSDGSHTSKKGDITLIR